MFWSVLLFACWPFVVLLLKHILDFSWHWELSPLPRLLPMQVFTRGVLLHTGLFHWNLPNLGRTRLSSSHERLCCRCLVTKSCLILLRPHGLWSARPSVRVTSQERILEWVAISFFRGPSHPRIEHVSLASAGRFLNPVPPGKPKDVIFAEFQACKRRSRRSLELLLLLDVN